MSNTTTVVKFQRLPTTIQPTHYQLKLEPNLETFEFFGEESINVLVKEESSKVILNAADLIISTASWKSSSSESEQTASSIVVDNDNGILTLNFEPPLQVGDGVIRIVFNGILSESLKGFYRSKYCGPDGQVRYNAVTQFESSDSRRAFPNWDEPAIRATFDITFVVPKDKVALSNMPVKKTSEHPTDQTRHIVEFERTPSMSTYLIAFIVGDFDYVEGHTSEGTVCRVYTPPGKKEQGRFALDVTVKVLPYYKDYFGIAYTLPKLDLIAIADFAIGAMENWGCITYRETCLLVDEANTSATNRQYVALVVGHEIAHQWFGNLVSLTWWTDLWLKEGYASFVEFLCVHHLFPEYDIWTQFVTDVHSRALELDSLDSSHPIEVEVGHPSEIDEIFDDISYNKGAAIIRMLHNYVGPKEFRKGMNIYLTRHQYGNACTENLWTALDEAGGGRKTVADVMTTWTKQKGFPIVTVSSSRQEGDDRILTLTQEKYCCSTAERAEALSSSSPSEDSLNWMIPLTFSSAKNPDEVLCQTLMPYNSMEVTLHNVDPDMWVKLNPGVFGFYRVRYTSEMLTQLLPAITAKTLPPLDRLSIIDDLFALVKAGQSSTVEVLKVLEAFIDEDNYTVWTSISAILGKLDTLLPYGAPGTHEAFKLHCQKILRRIVDSVGWDGKDNESHPDKLLRALVLHDAVVYGHEVTIKEAKARFQAHQKGDKIIPADLRGLVYKAALSDEKGETLDNIFDLLIKLYRESDLMEEKSRIARGFGAIKDPNLLQKVLEFSISEDVRSQDTVSMMVAVAWSAEGRSLAWEFFKKNVELFRKRYVGGSLMISRLVKNVAEDFAETDRARDLEEFFLQNPYPGTERSAQQAIENIRLNVAWLQRDEADIVAHLGQQ